MKIILTVFIFLYCLSLHSQDMKNYEGRWIGEIPADTFVFDVIIKKKKGDSYSFEIKNKNVSVKKDFNFKDGTANIRLDDNFIFTGYKEKDKIEGFISTGIMKHHLTLIKTKDEYKTQWHLLAVKDLQKEFFLSIEDAEGETYNAYSFAADKRVPNFMNYDFQKRNDTIFFKDFRTGIKYFAKLNKESLVLNFTLYGKNIATLTLKKSEAEWKPSEIYFKSEEKINDGWKSASPEAEGFDESILKVMTDSAESGRFFKTHSILISRNGKIVYEKYFDGFNMFTPHDMRSASKTISSAITGIAIEQGFIKDEDEYLCNLLSSEYKQYIESDASKKKIKLKDLMTMSSGIDAVDFGFEKESKASEDNYQNTDDWAKTVLEAPMINEPGTHALYGSANPFLLGLAVKNSVNEPLELFMHRNLFAKLGIENYLIQNDIAGNVYFAGGMYMRPRDMLKFGQLYLDSGKWNGEQIISKEWVKKSFVKYLKLENADDKNDYGFFWWHNTYKKGEESVEAIEARGAGGQYIILIPKYNMIAVITSGNFRNGKYRQPEKIMQDYILPAVK